MESKPARQRYTWTPDGEEKVISELLRAKTEGKMSDNGFKKSTFNEIARGLQITPPVNGTQVQTLFKRLKSSYKVVRTLRSQSGFGWDDDRKIVTAEDSVWELYLQKHEKAAHWRSHPFPLYDNMAELLDGVIPTGAHAFSSEFGPTPDDEAADEESLPGNLDPALFEKELSTDGEKDDDKGPSEVLAPVTPDVRSKKRAASTVMPSSGSVPKRIKKSGSQAFVELTDTLNSYVSTLIAPPMEHSPATTGPLSASPVRKDAAFRTVVEEEGLSPHSLAYARKVFRGNVELANEYLSFGPGLREARTLWLQDELERIMNTQSRY